MAKIVGIIPARLESRRFPRKVLAQIDGKSVIQRVWEGATQSTLLDLVAIATDSAEIATHCQSFCPYVHRTPSHFHSGSDRVAWTVERYYPEAQIVVNIQGDEPLLSGAAIDLLISGLQSHPEAEVATLIQRIQSIEEVHNPSIVKVVCDRQGFALYFSRSPLPYAPPDTVDLAVYRKHIGIYAFRRDTLRLFVQWQPSMLEKCESLEQLRLLEYGKRILCCETELPFIAVDIPEDIEKVRTFLYLADVHGKRGKSGKL